MNKQKYNPFNDSGLKVLLRKTEGSIKRQKFPVNLVKARSQGYLRKPHYFTVVSRISCGNRKPKKSTMGTKNRNLVKKPPKLSLGVISRNRCVNYYSEFKISRGYLVANDSKQKWFQFVVSPLINY
jgi:ribosomal protein L15E